MPSIQHVKYVRRPGRGAVDLADLKRKSWPALTAQFTRIAAPLTYDFKLTGSTNYVALHDLYRVDGVTTVQGVHRSHVKDFRNKITFAPEGCDIEGWSQIVKPASITSVFIPQNDRDKTSIDLAKLPPLFGFDDQMLRSVLSRFQLILHDPSLDCAGYAETLGVLLTFEIGRVASRQRQPVTHKGGLTARQARLVIDYIEGHIGEPTSISELAGLLDLTRFHFIRAFKQAVGLPPHRFMVVRRIERARELLTQQDLSIAEVAARVGFGNVAQFAKAFRRHVGTTPSTYRREQS